MSKLPQAHRFLDLSDYARPLAQGLVYGLIRTPVSSIQITFAFLAAGLLALSFTYHASYVWAAFFIMMKNILDAADGEMARARDHPTQTGRYLDSIFDFLINLGLFYTLFLVTDASLLLFIGAFLGLIFQGTIFNYYYLVQRQLCQGDITSRIDEFAPPVAFGYENPQLVRVLHRVYLVFYGLFDVMLLRLDPSVRQGAPLPNWFLTLVSTMGLGFQLLLIVGFMLAGRAAFILPFFLLYTFWGVGIILIRKGLIGHDAAGS